MAQSAGWTLHGAIDETVDVVTDRELDGDGDLGYGSTTRIAFDLGAATSSTEFGVDLAFVTTLFGGPDADGDDDQRLFDPSGSIDIQHNANSRWGFGLTGAVDVTSTSFSQTSLNPVLDPATGQPVVIIVDGEELTPVEFDIEDNETTRITSTARANADYAMTSTLTARMSATYRAKRFTETSNNFANSDQYSLRFGLTERVNQRLGANLDLNTSYLDSENDDKTQTWTTGVESGIDYRFDPRLRAFARAGPNLTFLSSEASDGRSTTVGAQGRAGVTWNATRATTLQLTAIQSLVTDDDGEQDSNASLAFNMRHSINHTTSGSLRISYSARAPGEDVLPTDPDQQIFNVSPILSLTLAPDWSASAGYSFTLEREESDDAISNRIFFQLSTRF